MTSLKKILKKSLTTLTLTAFTTALTTSTAFAGTLSVYSTSDVHGSIRGWNYFTAKPADVGLAKVSTAIKEGKAKMGKDDAMLIIDAGDIIQGTPLDTYMLRYPNEWKAGHHPMMEAFRTIGYDAILFGNHEFNFGLDYLQKCIALNKNILAGNVIDDKTGKTWSKAKPWLIKQVRIDGKKVKVGIIGTVTPAIPKFETPAHFAGVHFADQVPVFRQAIAELQAKGVDIIIGATHSGVERADRDSDENQVVSIARACPELDLLICAHNHVVIDNSGTIIAPDGTEYPGSVIEGVPVIESGKDGKFLGLSQLDITQDKDGKWQVNSVTTNALSMKGVDEDPEIVELVAPWHEKTLAYLQTQIGEATGDFIGAESNLQDSAIVDFVNDVQRYYAGTQLSAAAAFNTSQNIEKGPITLQQVAGLYIYENYLYGIEISGKDLKAFLEHAANYYGTTPNYNYNMVSGVDYTIDFNQPEGSRITRLQYQGEDVKDTDTFTIAMNDYVFNGGSGYMEAMGYTDGNRPKVVYDSLTTLSDDGQVRTLIGEYIKMNKKITPQVDNNWNVIPKERVD